jgi:hypothetical protein
MSTDMCHISPCGTLVGQHKMAEPSPLSGLLTKMLMALGLDLRYQVKRYQLHVGRSSYWPQIITSSE